ncbi:MAG: class I SAM-dependent methyltransferase [bacterium]
MVSPPLPSVADSKVYDEAYFAKWYRDPRTRVHTPESVRRKVQLVVGIAEYFLQRKVRSVLDIGAGEGTWRTELRRMRPRVRYVGVDPSEYVVRRHGRRRNIRQGRFEELSELRLGRGYDVIVCADMLQYVPGAALDPGLRQIAAMLGGVAYLEAFTSGDEMEGDMSAWYPRTASEYRGIFSAAGLVGCGMHCYLAPALADRAVELELSS